VVAINQFHTDTEAELQLVRNAALAAGAAGAEVTNHWAEGGAGSVALADVRCTPPPPPSATKYQQEVDMPLAEVRGSST
jgi:methylenetetrahydrofolate dehydrogenase (NADP+)/methenyltetrahydrofolate cyclohydrolase/formyltetrahydrofolate synthetase